ncbi:hypothetical protein BYT27DRAFT_7250977 [Phlegmacium glaucopus]|nr:hypothetical protein BYT27DRAFT_7250977 [Phlegmacium glaucopus]
MPLSQTYASLELGLNIGLSDCNEYAESTNSLQPSQISTSTSSSMFQLLTALLPAGVQNSPAEPVGPSLPLTVSLPIVKNPTTKSITFFSHHRSSRSKPKEDLYRQVLVLYLKRTAKGRALYRKTRKTVLPTANSGTELKWMMATHMPKEISTSDTKQSVANPHNRALRLALTE